MSAIKQQKAIKQKSVAQKKVVAQKKIDQQLTAPETGSRATTLGFSRVVHGLACLLTATVFPLIWVGGLVTTYDAGMAVPDWPGTYGSNMFLYPAATWVFGPFDLLVEHSHRLLGAVAGILCLGLVAGAAAFQPRRWFVVWTVLVLLTVISQGILGGVRVLLDARTVAMIHGCVGPLVFALATATAVMSSRWWLRQNGATLGKGGGSRGFGSLGWQAGDSGGFAGSAAGVSGAGRRLPRVKATPGKPVLREKRAMGRWFVGLAGAVVIGSYLQLIVGAQLRHVSGSTSPSLFTGFVHLHLTLAAVVLSLAIALAACTLWNRRLPSVVRWPASVLLGLVFLQIGLGVATWVVNYALPWEMPGGLAAYTIQSKGFVESMIVTGHVATGSLILSMSTVSVLRSWKASRTVEVLE